ncbi:MAG: hypothetical protein IK000_05090 [Bacteroidaceae bacterium]|nr:hypothetical protein [Bacteroidaceae bacterium]
MTSKKPLGGSHTASSFILATIVLYLFIGVCLASCSDEWAKHYSVEGMDSAADAPTLWAHMKSMDDELGELCRVLEHVGYDKVLDSPQSFTVWAPTLTQAQADSIIALYDQQSHSTITLPGGIVRNIQDKENKAITQFVQNHMALYGRSVPSVFNDTILMMNGKNMILTERNINGAPFVKKNIVACNGILYTLAAPLPFEPNVREALGLQPEMLDNVNQFFSCFDKYELDESSSVQQGIVDGKIIYADSVITSSNKLYSTLGWIEREDSDYFFFAPSDEVWNKEYDEYLPYFNYDDMVENRDSLARLNAQFAIVRGRFFNRRLQKNDGLDSIVNTMYVKSKYYYGLNVYIQPYATILAGQPTIECSNGEIIIDTEGRIDPKTTFLEDRYLLASNSSTRKSPLLLAGNRRVEAVSIKTRSIKDSVHYTVAGDTQIITFPELKEKTYIEVTPQTFSNVANRNSSIYFYLPNTFSGLYYNVYLVMVPAFANTSGYKSTDVLPTRFQVYYNERLQMPRTSVTDDPNDDVAYNAPDNERVLTVPFGETHKSGNQYFLTSGDKVDVICIDKARQPKVTAFNAFGTSTPAMRYRVTSNVRQSDLNKGIQTNVLRINRLIYIGFKTAEEAKAYQLDLSNLNEYNGTL